jgi:Putative restriction endonuclease
MLLDSTSDHSSGEASPDEHRYLRTPTPVYFPVSEEVPETKHHLLRRTALYQCIVREVAASATIGSDQFVYWDPTTSRKRLAPDVFVRLGVPDRAFRSWKIWERGAPDLGVEIVSDSDEGEPDWDEKLARYRAAGVREVVRFAPESPEEPVRVWDAIGGDLVERAPDDPRLHRCETLGLWWTVVTDVEIGAMLRLARDREGRDLLPTPDEFAAAALASSEEARRAEVKARKETEKARKAEAKARETSERLAAELRELRAQLAERQAKPGAKTAPLPRSVRARRPSRA